jgi:hypothetical protein
VTRGTGSNIALDELTSSGHRLQAGRRRVISLDLCRTLCRQLRRRPIATAAGRLWFLAAPRLCASQIFGLAGPVPEGGPAGTCPPGCAAEGAGPKPDTLAGGSCCCPWSRGGPAPGARDQSRREKHPDRQTYRRSGVSNAGPVPTKLEPGRRFVPGGRSGPGR